MAVLRISKDPRQLAMASIWAPSGHCLSFRCQPRQNPYVSVTGKNDCFFPRPKAAIGATAAKAYFVPQSPPLTPRGSEIRCKVKQMATGSHAADRPAASSWSGRGSALSRACPSPNSTPITPCAAAPGRYSHRAAVSGTCPAPRAWCPARSGQGDRGAAPGPGWALSHTRPPPA